MSGRLELSFVDVSGAPLNDDVDIRLRHHTLSEKHEVDAHPAARPIAIAGLRTEPQGLYVLEVRGRSYRPVGRFVTIPASGTLSQTVVLPIRSDRARAVFPLFDLLDERVRGVLERSRSVKGHQGVSGRSLYDVLGDEAKAGLLNIAKKSLATPFKNGDDLLQHITLLDALGDRCFVEVPMALKDQMPGLVDGELFMPVEGSLHDPPAGFTSAGSFKTFDAFGNLQLTFFADGNRCVADVDIDDAAGLLHVFQVLRNHLSGNPTHPYDIHQILVAHQHLDPGYQLVPRV